MRAVHFTIFAGALVATPAQAADGPKPLTARTETQAATMTLAAGQEALEICVRKPVVNSRVKFERVCMNQSQWKDYLASVDQMMDDWKNSGKGLKGE